MKHEGSEFLELGRLQVEFYLARKINYFEVLATCSVPREILVLCYESLLRRQRVGSIDAMLEQDKQWAKAKAIEIGKGRLGVKGLVDVVKAMVAIEYFLNLNL